VDWGTYVDVLARRLAASEVEVRVGVAASVDDVVALAPDHVVVATGADPWPAPFDVVATQVRASVECVGADTAPGERVLVVAGREDHADPPMTARRLVELGAEVVVTTEDLLLGRSIEPRTLHLLTARLARAGVTVHTSTRVVSVHDGTAELVHLLTGERSVVEGISLVVLALGRGANDELAQQLRSRGVPNTLVGDALAPRRLVHAVLDGARLGANL
jgi:pyruvate/2-oxoglutarate dehydrogenase complex dihydrolipoamide dehydrogenase (E3) component